MSKGIKKVQVNPSSDKNHKNYVKVDHFSNNYIVTVPVPRINAHSATKTVMNH